MAGEPKTPRRAPGTPERERRGDVQLEERREVERPKRFRVILWNDDYTPMEFVVVLLEQVFGKSPVEATQLMLTIHRTGAGTAGVYPLEVAETKVTTVHKMAEQRGYPLRAGTEPE